MALRERIGISFLVVGTCAALVWGWRTFWFLTDDAYIAFRYVSNSVLGHGYVWNAAPFRPVEGYTSFLWVILLDVVWRGFGVEPPDSANVIALLCGALTLGLGAAMVWRMRWPEVWRPYRIGCVAILLLGALSNRTFLTWTSSGLETALFNVLLVLWIYLMIDVRGRGPTGWLRASGVAALMALTRPDGLLYLAATLAAGAVTAWHGELRSHAAGASRQRGEPAERRRTLAATLAPSLLVGVHVLWRKVYYGFWLPNTYYAKVADAWPEAGGRYLLSFVLEYAYWAWALLAVLVLLRRRRGPAADGGGISWPFGVVVSSLLAHLAYYVLVVGGDHFEYRVLSHLVVPLMVAAIWLAARTTLRPPRALALLLVGILLSLPLPWTHWNLTRSLDLRSETHRLHVPLAPHFPATLGWYVGTFDSAQAWLIHHYIGLRHQEHKVNLAYVRSLFPERSEGEALSGQFPVMKFGAVGYLAWVLPHVNILDAHGLNDAVVARTPNRSRRRRQMAHEHVAPPDYLACFEPDVALKSGMLTRIRRPEPMTARRIEECEATWRAVVGLAR